MEIRRLCAMKTLTLLAMMLLAGHGITSDGMRCDRGLIGNGDWPAEVREACGEPDYRATYPQQVLGGIGLIREETHWYYNRGPNEFVRRLVFRNGELRRVETLGYGFAGSPSCSVDALRTGMSEFELHARCGEPEASRVEWRVLRQGSHYGATAATPVSEWLYSFGSTRFRRVVRLQDGRITAIERRDKPE